ncbi:MAG: hypothetical protein ACFCAD_14430, partial [Pleurocapsa sp.]
MIAILDRSKNSLNQKIYWFILFLVIFIPFEDFILKFLPVPDAVYFYTRFLSEVLVYGAFIVVTVQKVIDG